MNNSNRAVSIKTNGSKAYYLISFLLLLEPMFNEILPTPFTRGAFIAGVVLSTAKFIQNKTYDLKSIGVGALWMVFGALAFISHGLNADAFSFNVVFLLAMTYIVFIGAADRRWIMPMLHVMLAMLCVHMLATIIFYIQPQLYFSQFKPRFFPTARNAIGFQSGLTSHYSNNGMYQAIGLILAWSFFLNEKSKGKKVATLVISAMFLFALFLTQKRAHLGFGVFAVLVEYGMHAKNLRAMKVCGISALLVLAVCIAAQYNEGVSSSIDRLFSTFTESGSLDEATSGRVGLWEYAIDGWAEHPVFGNGWSTYRYVWPNLITVSSYAHNEILQDLYEVGLVGTLLFLVCAASSLCVTYHQLISNDTDGADSRMSLSFSFSYQLFALVYGCTTGVILQNTAYLFPYLLAVGIGFSFYAASYAHRKGQKRYKRSLV